MRSSHNVEAWDPNRVLGELDKLIVSAVPEDRPSLVVALAARLAQLAVGLVSPTTNGNGGRATTEVEMPSPFSAPRRPGCISVSRHARSNAFGLRAGGRPTASTAESSSISERPLTPGLKSARGSPTLIAARGCGSLDSLAAAHRAMAVI